MAFQKLISKLRNTEQPTTVEGRLQTHSTKDIEIAKEAFCPEGYQVTNLSWECKDKLGSHPKVTVYVDTFKVGLAPRCPREYCGQLMDPKGAPLRFWRYIERDGEGGCGYTSWQLIEIESEETVVCLGCGYKSLRRIKSDYS